MTEIKRPVIAVILLVSILITGITSYLYIKNSCNQMIECLDKILQYAETENMEEVTFFTAQANTQWKKEKFLFNIAVGSKDSTDVIMGLRRMEYFSETGNIDELINHTVECKVILLRIKESVEPEISTIL